MNTTLPKEMGDLSLTDPKFFAKAYSYVKRIRQTTIAQNDPFKNVKNLCANEYDTLSKEIDATRIQDSCSVRNVLRTRALATLLINDKGEIESTLLPELIKQFSMHLYQIGPNRQYDSRRQEHILKVLTLLHSDKNLVRLLKNISKPASHRYAEQIIRDTLQLTPSTPLTDTHARRAALSAWLCFLRQNVGSCFATAPAIIVHDEQPETFLIDVNDLLSTGRLKRTFGGIEYAVPLSASWGAGDVKKPFALVEEGKIFEIWRSPGFIQALKEVQLLNLNDPPKKKQLAAKKLVEDAIKAWNYPHQSLITTVEELLRRLLLSHHHLTQQDIIDYDNRPKEFVSSNLLIRVPLNHSSPGSKGHACARFKLELQQAKGAFNAIAYNALLKAWEFSLASFAETKADFTRWNLYSSLGLRPEEPGGIGEALFEILQKKLDECNEKIKETQVEYEQLYTQLKYVESRIKNASTEKEINWLRVEHQSRSHEFYALQDIRDGFSDRSKRFANLYDVMITFYDKMFPIYFQEVYDADMQISTETFYDDSPAGFRLIFKHGRSNTSQWTGINSPDEFIDNLSTFFISTENELSADPHLKGLEQDLSEIITSIITRIKTKEFLETSFHRMAIAHRTVPIKNPLENLDKIEKKPWSYTSGGTMGSLVSCYFRREQKPTEVGRWVESETELLVFFIDIFKQIPTQIMQEYLDKPFKSMLVHSPTHAFLLKPGLPLLKQAWNSEVFTFTWVRDQMIQPIKSFIENILLNEEMMQGLITMLLPGIPQHFWNQFKNTFRSFPGPMYIKEFRRYLLETLSLDKAFRQLKIPVLSADDIDSLLFTHLPLFPGAELRNRIVALFSQIKEIPSQIYEKIITIFDGLYSNKDYSKMIDAKEFQDIAKGLFCLATTTTSHSYDVHELVIQAARKLGYAMPSPISFADTNWVLDDFGFVFNPGTGRFELWRLDNLGSMGYPMTPWAQWLNGSRQDLTWGVYTRPYEYS